MDAFLRRVVELREQEQAERAFLLPTRCRLCRAQLKVHDNGSTPLTVCKACGGRKRQQELEQEHRLVQLAGITPTENEMEKQCTKCGKKLRANSQDECFACRTGAGSTTPAAPKSTPKSSVRKRFFTLAEALEQDPNEILERFMQGWINNLRNRVGADAD